MLAKLCENYMRQFLVSEVSIFVVSDVFFEREIKYRFNNKVLYEGEI